MSDFRVLSIPENVAQQARATKKSPQYGHPAHVEVATGYGPCRQCLRRFQEGQDSRLLFTYNPFEGRDPYPSPGPIFIHEQPCETYSPESGFPEELRTLPLVLEAYGRGRWLITQERVQDGKVEAAVEHIFSLPAVAYIHVRNLEAGCFIAQIEQSISNHQGHEGTQTKASAGIELCCF
jgi:hypothetical protein